MKTCYKIMIMIAVAILLGILISAFATAFKKNTEDECLKSQVRIYTKNACGMGTVIEKSSDEVLIVSNWHLLCDWDENGYVEFIDGTKAFGQIFGGDEVYDVCFLGIPKENISDATYEKIRQVALAESYKNVEDDSFYKEISVPNKEIILFNLYSESENPVIGRVVEFATYVYDMDKVMMLCKCLVEEGMSGAGIFDTQGNFLGIVMAGNDNSDMVGVSTYDIRKCLGPFFVEDK